MDEIQISLVFGTYNRLKMLKKCIESIRNNGIEAPYEIVVIDGGSTDGTGKWLIRQNDILSIFEHNRDRWTKKPKRSWAYAYNLGYKCAQGKYVAQLNDDILIRASALQEAYEFMEQQSQDVGACAFPFRDRPDEDKYKVGTTLGGKMFVNFGYYRKDVLEKVGFLDEKTYAFYHADGDLGLKIWNEGYRVVMCPDARIDHFPKYRSDRVRKANYKLAQENRDWEKYIGKWKETFVGEANPGGWIILDV